MLLSIAEDKIFFIYFFVNLAIYYKHYTIIIISAAAFNAAKGRCSKNEKTCFLCAHGAHYGAHPCRMRKSARARY